MLQVALKAVTVLFVAVGLSHAIQPYTPHLSSAQRFEYSIYIAAAAQKSNLDPYLVAAVISHESDFENIPRNATNDYGLMQVHWQPTERWLAGVSPQDLLDPWTNILAGTRELAALREYCRVKDPQTRHHWINHYKYGVVVPSQRYGAAVLERRNQLIRLHLSS